MKKGNWANRAAVKIVKFFYHKPEMTGLENIPDEPCIIIGNHTKLNGPFISQLYLPGKNITWCVGAMMDHKQVPAYAYKDFWSKKPKYIRWFFKTASYLIAWPAELIIGGADTLAVYHDSRLRGTYKEAVNVLVNGANNVIFPECNEKHNNIVYEFQDKFVDTAKYYYRKTGKKVKFVPMYIAPALKKVVIGRPIEFDPDVTIDEERSRICNYLMDNISEMAYSLPRHKVVPYPNIPKRLYNENIREETEK